MLSLQDEVLSELCFNTARIAHQTEQYPSAEHYYKRCLQLNPDNKDAEYALIYPYALQRKYEEAIAQCTKAMSGPKADDAHYTRGLIYLNMNDYKNGFEDFEIRLKQRPIAAIHDKLSSKPYWSGEDCKTLYVFGEQGFGDIIMFSRYLPLIKSKFKVDKIYFEVPKGCNSLFKYNFRNNPEIEVISVRSTYELLGTDKEFISSDYYIQQISLARIFGTTFDTVPDISMAAEPEFIEKFKHLSAKNTIAVCCGGRAENGDPMVKEWNDRRNVDPRVISEILKDYNLVSLQKELNPELNSWSDTAGLLANCKFVVTIDSGPVHLAGALGCNTILLNHYNSCWRWQLQGNTTPWYGDNLFILRQVKDRDWSTVYNELGQLVNYWHNSYAETRLAANG